MGISLASVSKVGSAASTLGNLVMVSPQTTVGYQPILLDTNGDPLTKQPDALLFHYEAENKVDLKSDITDHYVEDNTAINDHIGLAPEVIGVHGFIGELNDIPVGALAILKSVTDRLTVISAYAPQLSTTGLIAYNNAFQIYQTAKSVINSAVSTWSSINGTGGTTVIGEDGMKQYPNQTKQQLAFQQFYGYWRNRTLFTVQTPWAIFQNCAIQSLSAIQGNDTNEISDFEISFKVIRFAYTSATKKRAGRNLTQGSSLKDLGTSALKSVNTTFSSLMG